MPKKAASKNPKAEAQNASLAAMMSSIPLLGTVEANPSPASASASASASAAASASASASASAAKHVNPSLEANTAELCQIPCVSHITDDTGTEIKCDKPLTSNDRFDKECRTLKHDNAKFYEKIGDKWKKYGKAILEGFPVNDLHAQHGVFEAMLSTIFPKKRIIYSEFKKHTDKYIKCEDLVCIYGIPTGPGYGMTLFHISLHPAMPLYTMGQTRAAYTCGAYPASGGKETGPFHYKIDHIVNETPYRELKARSNGTFTLSEQDFYYTFQNKDVSLSMLHEYIYLRFIKYWNRCIIYLLTDGNNIDSNTTPWSMLNPAIIQNNDCDEMKKDITDALYRSTIHKKLRTSTLYDNALSVIELLEEEQTEMKQQKNAELATSQKKQASLKAESQQKHDIAAEAAAKAADDPSNSKKQTAALLKKVLGGPIRGTVRASSKAVSPVRGTVKATSPKASSVASSASKGASPKASKASAAASSASKGTSPKKKGGSTRKRRVYRRHTHKK